MGLIEQPKEEDQLEELRELNFEVKYVDLEELSKRLHNKDVLETFSCNLHAELSDLSWYEIFDNVSGRKETQQMEEELEQRELQKKKVIEQL